MGKDLNSREGFKSRLGFILVSAGCAIGIGNVWKFPYIAGQNGGAVFVFFYLLFLVLMGIPVLIVELAVGRGGKRTCVEAFRRLEPAGKKWHLFGWICLGGCYLLMMYYTTVSGWMLSYFYRFITGQFNNATGEEVTSSFLSLLDDPVEMTVCMAIVVFAGFGVLCFGVRKGLERVTKVMMSGLLFLIVALAVNSIMLENSGQGLAFYLKPNWDSVKNVGILNVITASITQAFFTLSLGIGAMEIFGSYMSSDSSLTGESMRICALDTFVAIISGLIIFPACFSFGIEPAQGPSLIFVTLPNIFANMSTGWLWGALFFLFMTFASFSTVTAVFENLVVSLCDNFGWSRRKSIIVNLIIILFGSMPCVLGYNVLKDLKIIGGRDILDSEDFVVSNILLPLGAIVFLLFCVLKSGWGFENFLKEANTGKGIKLGRGLKVYFAFVLPVLILLIFINGLVPRS